MVFQPPNESDRAYKRYELSEDDHTKSDIPSEEIEYVDTVQQGAPEIDHAVTDPEAYPNRTEEDPVVSEPLLEDVADADDLHPDSPIDPASPVQDEPHGTDLLNGAGGDEGRRALAAESEDAARPLISDGNRETERNTDPQDDLVTERDTDPEGGMFREGSFPGSLPDEVQENLIDSEMDAGYKDEVHTDEDA
ncbi:hypothetical protein [Saccharibacillus kuerlensis]|uniref:DUF5709 domain-containing protein n=1 Tax=Saccharibacillus kuerlensis TaxID=459527 RepID=A0ABQ2L0K3_9BACL|nr:hypothetical protein [Saccharibacillus kuerlensis]GGN98794.1 hypothetical protein GCM10010969_18290 [Saccharibacillus kuerlensis]